MAPFVSPVLGVSSQLRLCLEQAVDRANNALPTNDLHKFEARDNADFNVIDAADAADAIA